MGRPAISLGIIIQARVGSTRLPGKVLLPIRGEPLLGYILSRLTRLQPPASAVVATTDLPRDDFVAELCRDRGVLCFRGSEDNVLERFFRCAQLHAFTQIVRLTADNPFPDIDELERLITFHIGNKFDFSNSRGALPVGVGADIFAFSALQKSFLEGHEPHHIEHVDEYMLENPDKFRTGFMEIKGAKNRPDIRLTVDTDEDYRKACFIADSARNAYVGTEEAIELCMRYA